MTGDTNGRRDIFVRDRSLGTTERANVSSAGAQSTVDHSFGAGISGNGRFVGFASAASDLVSGDTNFFFDIFVRDRIGGSTVRASVTSSGAQSNNDSGNGNATASLSSDGSYVAFPSSADNLVTGDTNGAGDLFVRLPLTFGVDTTSDANLQACTGAAGDCSLRGAINRANASLGADEISFNIPGAGPHTIAVGPGGLPAIGGPGEIDATTQPRYAGSPLIGIQGSGAGAGVKG